MRQKGYTLLETVVALTILSIGSAVLWYSVRSASRGEKINRIHQLALSAAESDLEALHGAARGNIRDTAYTLKGLGMEELRVVRTVFDSAKIVNTLSEIVLDSSMSPKELQKPLEVKVEVFQAATEGEGRAPEEPQFSLGAPGEEARAEAPLISLTVKLPDYQWY